ncbi:hypothetical protein POTOM_024430 [Populus tomentosa]|uniref:Uncharacterized protein n=1 Tax=Populus tomentosa TaxID=118781 RepID=A0A8X7ZRX7_POPTO|nr:hypothetical protein POTOM_024430 [Populus tomentosa]
MRVSYYIRQWQWWQQQQAIRSTTCLCTAAFLLMTLSCPLESHPSILSTHPQRLVCSHGITDPKLYVLDEFEDVEYERVTVDVFLMVSCQFILRRIGIEFKTVCSGRDDKKMRNRDTRILFHVVLGLCWAMHRH